MPIPILPIVHDVELPKLIEVLRLAGVTVSPDIDPKIAARLYHETMAIIDAGRRNRRPDSEIQHIKALTRHLQTLTAREATAKDISSKSAGGSARWRVCRVLEEIQSELIEVEDALVKATQQTFAGYVVFSPIPTARPTRHALVEFVESLCEREVRNELPYIPR